MSPILLSALFLSLFQAKGLVCDPGQDELGHVRKLGRVYPFVSSASFSRTTVSPNGKRLAALDADHTIHTWGLDNWRLLGVIKTGRLGIRAILFLDEDRILVAGHSEWAQIYRLSTGTKEGSEWDLSVGTTSSPLLLSDSKNKDLVYYAGNRLLALDAKSGKILKEFGKLGSRSETRSAGAIGLSRDGKRLYVATPEQIVEWDTGSGVDLRTFKLPKVVVSYLSVDDTGTKLLTGHTSGSVTELNLEDGTLKSLLKTPKPFRHAVRWCGYLDGSRSLFVVHTRGSVLEIDNETVKNDWLVSVGAYAHATYLREKNLLILPQASLGYGHGIGYAGEAPSNPKNPRRYEVIFWDLKRGTYLGPPNTPNLTRLRRISASQSGERLLTVSTGQILLWDVNEGKSIAGLSGNLPVARDGVLSPDGKRAYLSSGKNHSDVVTWNFESEKREGEVKIGAPIGRMWLSENGQVLSCVSTPGTQHVVNLSKNAQITTLPKSADTMRGLALSPNGTLWAINPSIGGLVELWNTRSQKRITSNTFSTYPISVAFDGTHPEVFVGDRKAAYMWNYQENKTTAYSTEKPVFSIVPLGNSRAAMAVGDTVVCYDFSAKEVFALGRGHTATVTHLAARSDGRVVYSASRDGTLRIWQVPRKP